jgi:hypothetical protein
MLFCAAAEHEAARTNKATENPMSDFAWFKLLIRAIGVLLIGLSIPMVLYTIGFGIANQLSNSMPLSALVIPWLPMLAGYGDRRGLVCICWSERRGSSTDASPVSATSAPRAGTT